MQQLRQHKPAAVSIGDVLFEHTVSSLRVQLVDLRLLQDSAHYRLPFRYSTAPSG